MEGEIHHFVSPLDQFRLQTQLGSIQSSIVKNGVSQTALLNYLGEISNNFCVITIAAPQGHYDHCEFWLRIVAPTTGCSTKPARFCAGSNVLGKDPSTSLTDARSASQSTILSVPVVAKTHWAR